jgi:hypothetical protein
MGASILMAALALSQQVAPTDTLVVRADAGPDSGLELVEDSRIGSLDGPPETTFGYVSALVEAANGDVFVADGMATGVRVFDGAGSYLRDVGARGQGPGEFRQVDGMALTPEGDLAIWDYNSQRLSIFGPGGDFLWSFPVDVRVMLGGAGPALVVDAAGHYLVRTSVESPQQRSREPREREAIYAWLRYSRDGEFVDSLIPPRRRPSGTLNAFKHETASALSPLGYVVSGRNDEYALHRPLADGRIVRIERAYSPVPLQGDERDQWNAHLVEWEARWRIDLPELPRDKPPWRALLVDADGRIWVERYTRAEHHPDLVTAAASFGWPNVNWVEPVVYDLFDPRGSFIGSVTLPDRSEMLYASGAHVWVRWRGPFDEHYVIRYSMRSRLGEQPLTP